MKGLITRDSKVLDIGCGTGYFLKSLKNNQITDNLYALDISKVIIDKLGKEGIRGSCSKLPEIPYDDESFDFVTAKAVFEHLKTTDESIKSMVRVLRKGGKLLVSVPNNRLGSETDPEHFRKYTSVSLKNDLDKYITVKEIKIIDNCLLAICEK